MLNLEDEQTSLKSPVANTQDNFSRENSEENLRLWHLNLWKVGMTPPHFYLLAPRWVDKQLTTNPKTNQYLTEEQARNVYKKTELGGIIIRDTLHQEIEQERQLNRIDDTSGETNP